jgi:hypothetical protein
MMGSLLCQHTKKSTMPLLNGIPSPFFLFSLLVDDANFLPSGYPALFVEHTFPTTSQLTNNLGTLVSVCTVYQS